MTLIQPFYLVSVTVGVVIALAFPVTKHIRERKRRREYYILQAITIVGAVLGAKLSVLIGDYNWPWKSMEDWSLILYSGRSITGALIGGFLAAEAAKPWLGYTMPPNDRFAAVLPFSIAIGRIGCLLTGCCRGAPWDGYWAIHYADGIPRHPAQVYELIFHVSIGLTFIWMVKRGLLFGRLFSLYLVLYGGFRFLTEPLRETPKTLHGFSGYQWLSLLMIGLGGAFLIIRSRNLPAEWEKYRPALKLDVPQTETAST